MSFKLTGKSAIVFGGGSSGNGLSNGMAISLAYAQSDARVIIVDHMLERANETVAKIASEGGVAEAVEADVVNARQVKYAVDRCAELYGSVDIIHNNVGISLFGDPVELNEEDWDLNMTVNVKSAFLSSKFGIPYMLKQGKGRIISTSSIMSSVISEYPVYAYAASKAALEAFTRMLAVQYANRGIRANVVTPGLINTPQVREHAGLVERDGDTSDEMVRRDARCPTGKMGEPWDIAWASVFLASDQSHYINGQCLVVDGGISVKQA